MKRSKFNLSHSNLLTLDMGQLVPLGCPMEVLPGDTIEHVVSLLCRAMPLQTPPMHRVRMKIHHWYVPHRIIMDDWEDFITGGPDGNDATVFLTISLAAVAEKSLADYLGVPVGFTGPVSALPFRAYAKIFNENYRDQDLVTAVAMSTGSGVDATTNTTLLNTAWDKDYFTTSRPWEAKGPTVTVPFATTAPIKSSGSSLSVRGAAGGMTTWNTTGAIGNSPTNVAATAAGAINLGANGTTIAAMYADLAASSSVDINTVREAFALQRYQEARARYGSRYTEYLQYLGIRNPSDARLQRPEYLGGGVQNLSFSEVLQTASTTAAEDGVGTLYGHGIGAMRSNRYRKFFEEHGYIVSLLHVLPETMYPQGLFRTWNRRVKEDFWQKELQHIGQQPVLMKEVYALGAGPDTTFGYQDRYDDYRRMESRVHGEFMSTLSDWHFARLLAAQPTLNGAFVTADPTKRPFQAQGTNSTLLVQARHRVAARRMVAASGTSFIF
ncbi:major capsid protein [Apis mellifera associated microvirus 48]|nr:major capsid protein [Apis mellifera associated microvirus 48]